MDKLKMCCLAPSEMYEIRSFRDYRVHMPIPTEPGIKTQRLGEIVPDKDHFQIYIQHHGTHHRLAFMDGKGVLKRPPQIQEDFDPFFKELQWAFESEEWVFDKNGFFLRGYKSRPSQRRRVVSAALLYEGKGIICSPRHFDELCHQQLSRVDYFDGQTPIQGFVDQYGEFMTRQEAWVVAIEANQIIRICGGNEEGVLYSENLY